MGIGLDENRLAAMYGLRRIDEPGGAAPVCFAGLRAGDCTAKPGDCGGACGDRRAGDRLTTAGCESGALRSGAGRGAEGARL